MANLALFFHIHKLSEVVRDFFTIKGLVNPSLTKFFINYRKPVKEIFVLIYGVAFS